MIPYIVIFVRGTFIESQITTLHLDVFENSCQNIHKYLNCHLLTLCRFPFYCLAYSYIYLDLGKVIVEEVVSQDWDERSHAFLPTLIIPDVGKGK